jgi:DNA-binding response OmpR family regulator
VLQAAALELHVDAVRILLVEDDREIADAVRIMLERRKFSVTVAGVGPGGLAALTEQTFDAAVIDVSLPRQDGFSVCRSARAAGVHTPVLMLTARDAIEDRVRGLDSGADDYLIKPFVEEELAARLRALMRRQALPIRSRHTAGDLTLDSGARTLEVAGRQVEVGATEFRVLEYLLANTGVVLSRDQIVDRVWGPTFEGSFNIVEVYISALRRKLRGAGAVARIVTVWGVGYKLTAS